MRVRIVRKDRKDPLSWASAHVGEELAVKGIDDCQEPAVYVSTDEQHTVPVYCARVMSRQEDDAPQTLKTLSGFSRR